MTEAGPSPSIWGRLDRWWFEPAPALRLAVLRVLILGYGLIWLIGFSPMLLGALRFEPDRFAPVGVVSLLDAPLGVGVGVALWLLAVVSGVAALLGWRFRLVAPVHALALLWVASYRNSWGMVFHTDNLLVMHTLILALLPASDAWSLDARRGGAPATSALDPRYGWGPKLMATITTIAYVLAGVAKLRNAGGAWLDGGALLNHVAWDNLRKVELGATHSPLGAALCAYPAVFVPLAWMSMVLELGAPIALLGRRLAWAWTIGMWCFHIGVAAIMAIVFAYPVSGLAFAPLFAVEVPALSLAARARARWPKSRLLALLPTPAPTPISPG
ncbi:Vitamin K-dependent gamma-carboxylase [Enhygromyxa salina]|uniref:Vitamin K-dependent gamma-carboxylase n=1 Tax=Enhygromyxa salina TaxID=215803 RepID=A0A2S9XBL6_9BACT|nr:HTTM domain-containing protein [Enhygromyxa salina]PRP90249.1 Vitamin K-dependent gamma-carboxylase [Enhygromyxa salina]